MTAVALLSFAFAAHALDAPPIPRPSPLTTSDAPADTVAPDAAFSSEPTDLSPGALLDPTNGVTFDLPADFGDANGSESLDPSSSPGSADAQSGTLAGGNNPLLGQPPSTAAQPTAFRLEARLKPDGTPLPRGINWRVFGAQPMPNGKLPFMGEAQGGSIEVRLAPGDYLVHAAYGRAGATERISVGPTAGGETVVINAGGLKLSALVGEDKPLTADDVSFDIYAPDESGSGERVLLVPDAPPDKVIGLNAGVYHVVCRYGDANAVVRADIRVEAGNLTEATVYQKAARLTLKLVDTHGGEALANTSWAIVTPQGDSVVESVGAFPTVILAEGEYTAVARHEGKSYEQSFKVEPGRDRDVEVIAK